MWCVSPSNCTRPYCREEAACRSTYHLHPHYHPARTTESSSCQSKPKMNSVLTGEAKHTAPALDTHDFIPNNLAAQTSLQWGDRGWEGVVEFKQKGLRGNAQSANSHLEVCLPDHFDTLLHLVRARLRHDDHVAERIRPQHMCDALACAADVGGARL